MTGSLVQLASHSQTLETLGLFTDYLVERQTEAEKNVRNLDIGYIPHLFFPSSLFTHGINGLASLCSQSRLNTTQFTVFSAVLICNSNHRSAMF